MWPGVAGSQTYGATTPAFTYTSDAPTGVSLTGTLTCTTVNGGTAIAASLEPGSYTIDGPSCSGLSASDTSDFASLSYTGVSDGFVVGRAPLHITADDQTMSYGGAVPAFTASHDGLVNGDTASVVSGLSCGPVDANGNPLDAATATAGTYAIACSGGSATDYAITYGQGTLTIDREATSTGLTAQPGSTVWGQPVTFTADISARSPGSGVPAGTVEFKDGPGDIAGCSAQAVGADGTASCTTSALAVGSHRVTATYGGDPNFIGSTTSSALTLAVTKAGTSTAAGSDGAVMAGQPVVLTATATPVAPGAGAPTGAVTFYQGATNLGTGQLNSSGQASLQVSGWGVGPHTVTASYGGDVDFNRSTSSVFTQYVNTNLSNYPTLTSGAYDLANTNLSGGYLVDEDLSGANVSNSNLKGADLTGSNLSGANLTNSNLMGANLTGANLTGANLKDANLKDANLNGVTWSDTTCPDGTLSDADGGSCAGHL